jgi:LuxR family maltose regulon positive regulatory protein
MIYLLSALQTIDSNLAQAELNALQSSQPLPTDKILTSLINEVASGSDKIILILDDYHLIEDPSIHETLTYLLEHLPPQLHLVIATREDPDLPLPRLRAKDQLTELRVADLRFTISEAADFLNHVMGLGLSAEDISALERRTEGWIAGLQMAAISMQGRGDTASFIKAFTGSHHFVLDYLVEEVLQRQTERVRRFLLQTSILDRLSGSLCDAVTGQEDGKGVLAALEGGNLFVVPLDDRRQWYRYHHLFADVLQTYLMDEQPDEVPVLHRRASEWYERNDLRSDAIRHALAAEDFEWAAGLIELAWPEMDWSFQSTAWLGWVKAIPEEIIRARPVLSVGYAWALLNDGELEAGEARLRDAEWWLEPTTEISEREEDPTTKKVVVDEEQFQSLPVSIASARAYHAQALGDVPGSVKFAQRALDLIPEGDNFERGRAAVLLALAHLATGELEAAHRSFSDAMTSFKVAGNIMYAISFTFILADIRITQGRLHEAISTYEQSLQLVSEQDDPELVGTGNLYLGLSELHREQNDMEASRQDLQRSKDIGEQSDVYLNRWCLAQARIKEAQGQFDSALKLLDEAARHLDYRNPMPDVRPIAALKTRVWIKQGKLAEAMGCGGRRRKDGQCHRNPCPAGARARCARGQLSCVCCSGTCPYTG